MKSIKQNLAISFAYNILSLGLVATAMFLFPTLLNPAFGAALMVVQSACVLANAYRIKIQDTGTKRAQQSASHSQPIYFKGEEPVERGGGYNLFYSHQSQPKIITRPISSNSQSLRQTLV
jgi:hypothetical protein